MFEDLLPKALFYYLQAHPLVTILLVVMLVMFLGSLQRKFIKVAMVFGLLLLASLYNTNVEASEDWGVRATVVKRHAAVLGKEALEKGAKLLQEGKRKLEKQIDAR